MFLVLHAVRDSHPHQHADLFTLTNLIPITNLFTYLSFDDAKVQPPQKVTNISRRNVRFLCVLLTYINDCYRTQQEIRD